MLRARHLSWFVRTRTPKIAHFTTGHVRKPAKFAPKHRKFSTARTIRAHYRSVAEMSFSAATITDLFDSDHRINPGRGLGRGEGKAYIIYVPFRWLTAVNDPWPAVKSGKTSHFEFQRMGNALWFGRIGQNGIGLGIELGRTILVRLVLWCGAGRYFFVVELIFTTKCSGMIFRKHSINYISIWFIYFHIYNYILIAFISVYWLEITIRCKIISGANRRNFIQIIRLLFL